MVVAPQQGRLIGLFLCPGVDDVKAEVEIFGHIHFKMFVKIFIRGKFAG